MIEESYKQILESTTRDKLLLHTSPLFGEDFDPSKYSERVQELNGEKTPVCRQEFPPSIVQKSGNYIGGSL